MLMSPPPPPNHSMKKASGDSLRDPIHALLCSSAITHSCDLDAGCRSFNRFGAQIHTVFRRFSTHSLAVRGGPVSLHVLSIQLAPERLCGDPIARCDLIRDSSQSFAPSYVCQSLQIGEERTGSS